MMAARTLSPVSPGTVRTSTWSSTASGITFVFTPPCAIVGANVVRVIACSSRARPIWSSAASSR